MPLESRGIPHRGQASYLLMRNPKRLAVIQLLRQTLYQGELANQALGTFRKVMEDPDAPASARESSSRTVLELAGELNRDKIDNLSGRSLAELTPDEFSSLIDRWEGERMSLAKGVTPAGTG